MGAPVQMGENRFEPPDECLPLLLARLVINAENHRLGHASIEHLHAASVPSHDTTLFLPSMDSALQALLISVDLPFRHPSGFELGPYREIGRESLAQWGHPVSHVVR